MTKNIYLGEDMKMGDKKRHVSLIKIVNPKRRLAYEKHIKYEKYKEAIINKAKN